ncbi:family 2 glycosyl transferase [Actinosynnema sp. NPDC047251]|uniref:Glycosyltransferase, family 2 n=1 Tax=Saccharothrix espanaensis (strain ATCC 51144 / DSM 44229 / JCM 9112 / NBRC 15066 / NRRL 15764) TaxID=1179773 RepID=K0K4W8_SACES|nr:glycosyl transferase family 2 [Saccharothrix espanaensis]CCH33346.1 Glycosyltransferase, family 2 [Saccharothrix espanaensis DSM 44229]
MANRDRVTVVGIPARDEARTVGLVASAADAGLHRASPDGVNVVVLAENGSTDGTVERFAETPLRARGEVVSSPGVGTGKGTNVFAVMDRALELAADRVLLLDADVRSAEPEWVERLADAVAGAEPVLAVPAYRRDRYEANTTNHLASPLLAAVYGVHVQQPIGGEFAFNRAFLERSRGWPRPESASLYGIDVWLTANALREHVRVVEVPLGRKLHNSPFPKILRLPQQVLDSLFHVVLRTDRVRPAGPGGAGGRSAVDGTSVRQDPEVVSRVSASVVRYLEAHREDVRRLFPSAEGVRSAPWGLRVTSEVWPHVLADALAAVAAGLFEPARDHLVALYVNRVLTFWEEIDGLAGSEVDRLLDRQAAATVRAVRDRGVVLGGGGAGPGRFDVRHWAGFNGEPVTPRCSGALFRA